MSALILVQSLSFKYEHLSSHAQNSKSQQVEVLACFNVLLSAADLKYFNP